MLGEELRLAIRRSRERKLRSERGHKRRHKRRLVRSGRHNVACSRGRFRAPTERRCPTTSVRHERLRGERGHKRLRKRPRK
jgi:hypothetical protein